MQLYKSAFHPDSGELQNVFGRMSFQVKFYHLDHSNFLCKVPGGMLITGAMLQFYKSVPQVVFWQWFNQSFNALVNYTNRNANSPTSTKQLGVAYFSATFSALGTAIGLKKVLEKSPPTFQRLVPMVAVAAANCVNNIRANAQQVTSENDVVVIAGEHSADETGGVIGWDCNHRRQWRAGLSF